MQNRIMNKHIALAAAAALTLASSAFAQFRTGNDGRARDANNMIGSGGYNASNGNASIYNNSIGNQIVSGTVTGGKAFNFGNNQPYSDPRQFRGSTANTVSDRFIQSSSAAPFGGVPQNNAQVTQPFYGSRLASAPPQGFVQQAAGTGAFVPSSATLTRPPGDYRLGNITPSDIPLTQTPQPGQLLLPGPVDNNTQTLTVASPLYGVRTLNSNNLSDQGLLTNHSGTGDVANQIDPTTLQRLRSELTEPASTNRLNSGQLDTNNNNNSNNPNNPNAQQNGSSNQLQSTQLQSTQIGNNPFGQANNGPIDNRVDQLAQGTVGNNGPLSNDLTTGAGINRGIQPRSNLMAPERQSTALQQMSERLAQYRQLQGPGMIPNKAVKGPGQRVDENKTGTAGNPANPSGINSNAPATPEMTSPAKPAPKPGAVFPSGNTGIVPPTMGGPTQSPMNPIDAVGTMQNMPSAMNLPKPVQIHSLAEGVQAKGLADLLKQAEDDAKAGHYSTALEQYDLAEQVAPNNPLIGLGRANVELAQGYYGRAENHLKDAFQKNPQLLMGQYDLRNLLGDERLDFLVKDLKEAAKNNQKEARPLFLLAYVAYNTNNERMAAGYIDLAQKRAGGDDKVYSLIRSHWSLPTTSNELPQQPMNK